MTGPHLTPDDDRERAFALWCAHHDMVEDETAPHGEAFSAGWDAALDAEREALNQARTALEASSVLLVRAARRFRVITPREAMIGEIDAQTQANQVALGLAVAEADKPHDGNER